MTNNRFCPKNHDTYVVGRNKAGECRECVKIWNKIYNAKPHRKEKEQIRWEKRMSDPITKMLINTKRRISRNSKGK